MRSKLKALLFQYERLLDGGYLEIQKTEIENSIEDYIDVLEKEAYNRGFIIDQTGGNHVC